MATAEGLRFFLTADVKEFERALKDAATLSKQTADGIVKAGVRIAGTGDYVASLNKDLHSLVASMKDGSARFVAYGASVDRTGKTTQNFTNKTGNASTALFGLTRIAQDAPFGFIAIGNNLAETVTQMGALIKTSGGVGGALKSLGSTLIGPGGVVLGLNLLITGITVAVQKYGSFGAAINAILNPLSEQAKLQKEISDTMLEGAKNAQTEIAKVESLYRAARDLNIPLAERNKIVDELQRKYPSYFQNFSNEEIIVGKAAIAYDRLKNAIIAKAQAQAAEGKIAEIESKRLDIQTSLLEKSQQLSKADQNLKRVNAEYAEVQKKGVGIGQGAIQTLDKYQSSAMGLGATVTSLTSDMRKLNEEDKGLISLRNQLSARINGLIVQNGTDVLFDETKAKKEVKTIYDAIEGIERINQLLDSGRRQDIFIKPEITKFQAPELFDQRAIAESAARYADGLAKAIKFQFGQTVIPAVEISAKNLNEILEKSLVNGIGEVSAGIGKAIAGGGVSGIISGFVNMIAGFMEELGTLLIANGISLEAFKNSLKTLQGAPAIIAGAALVAAAGAFRAFANKGPSSFATGGTVYGPQLIAAGDNTTQKEHILSDMQLQKIAEGAGIGSGGDVIAETFISGNQLAILLKRSGYQISRIN